MSSEKIYLDSCILIGHIHKKHKNNKIISKCISSIENLDLDIYSSDWALAETVKVLVKEHGYPKKRALELTEKLREEKKIGKIPIKWLIIGISKKYGSKEFFEHLRKQMLEAKELHVADAIHSIIMANNKIEDILTTDKDFNALKTVNVITPKTLAIIKPKNKIKKKKKTIVRRKK